MAPDPDQSAVTKDFQFSEMEHFAPVFCPKNYFISEIRYFFVRAGQNISDKEVLEKAFQNVTLSRTLSFWNHVNLLTMLDQKFSYPSLVKMNSNLELYIHTQQNVIQKDFEESLPSIGSCPNLIQCLGHQACIFRVSLEFCHNDPNPGKRKHLILRMRCERNSVVSENLHSTLLGDSISHYHQARTDTVAFYRGVDNADKNNTSSEIFRMEVHKSLWPETAVFDVSCPERPQQARYV